MVPGSVKLQIVETEELNGANDSLYSCFQANTAILEQLIELRAKLSKLLGFSNHANYMLEMTMAKNSENVAQYLGMFLNLYFFFSFLFFISLKDFLMFRASLEQNCLLDID